MDFEEAGRISRKNPKLKAPAERQGAEHTFRRCTGKRGTGRSPLRADYGLRHRLAGLALAPVEGDIWVPTKSETAEAELTKEIFREVGSSS
jgi:hypothetical protein